MNHLHNIEWQRIQVPSAGGVRADPHAADSLGGETPVLAAMRDSRVFKPFLRQAVHENRGVLLIVNDPERSTRTDLALCALDDFLQSTSWSDRLSFEIVVATGTHKSDEDVKAAFERAQWRATRLSISAITWHEADDAGQLVEVGDLTLHQAVARAKFIMPIGSVEPHYFAGVTGPHKTCTIGVMSRADIAANHAGAMSPRSRVLALDGNPVFDGIRNAVETLKAAGKQLCGLSQVLIGDRVADVRAGDPVEVVREQLPLVRELYSHEIRRPFDIAVLNVSAPLDCTLYQADKALKNNHAVVRRGGGIVLVAPCQHGIGPPAFLDLLREANSTEHAIQLVKQRGYRLGDHKAIGLWRLLDPAAQGVKVCIVSETLDPALLDGTGLMVEPNQALAMGRLISATGDAIRRGIVIDDAAFACTHLVGGTV